MYITGTSSSSSVRTKSKLRLDPDVLDRVREKFIKQMEDTEELVTDREVTEEEIDQEEEEEQEKNEYEDGIIVERGISHDVFLNYQNQKNDGVTGFKMSLLDGKVTIHDILRSIHAVVGSEIPFQIRTWSNNSLLSFNERSVITDRNTVVIPDGSVQPEDLSRPPAGQGCDKDDVAYPTVVVEVGLSEGVKSLHLKARKYFSPRTTIQIYLAIKIFGVRSDGTRALAALLYERTNGPGRPTQVISFGSAAMHISTLKFFRRRRVPDQDIKGFGRHNAPPCNGAGILIYQVNIPSTAIFSGSPSAIPANLVNGCNIDLFRVKRGILALL